MQSISAGSHWVPLCMTHKTRSGYGSNKTKLRDSRGIWKNLVFIVELQFRRRIEVDKSGQKMLPRGVTVSV